jgi:hypothetical protein
MTTDLRREGNLQSVAPGRAFGKRDFVGFTAHLVIASLCCHARLCKMLATTAIAGGVRRSFITIQAVAELNQCKLAQRTGGTL